MARMRRRRNHRLGSLALVAVLVWALTGMATAGPLRLVSSGGGLIDLSTTGRFVLLHRDGRVPHYVRLDRVTGEQLGLPDDVKVYARMAPGGRVFYWMVRTDLDLYRQVGSNPPSRVFDAPNGDGWYFIYKESSADG